MDAQQWLEECLIQDGRARLKTPEAIALVKSQAPEFQIAILRVCNETLPLLRERWSEREVYQAGEQLYTITGHLYDSKLPFEEPDLCALLRSSQHSCGHGCDVQAPLDLAIAHLTKHDASDEMLTAIADYAKRLKGIGSIQAQTIKRKVSILLLLDRTGKLDKRPKAAWSRCFTRGLGELPAEQRRAWQRLVLSFKLNEQSALPKTWRKVAEKFISELGADRVFAQLENWWPEPGSVCKLDTGGSHLLKHFVWLLEAVDDSELKPKCHQLVCALSQLEWKPQQPAAKVLCAAAQYLTRLPRSVAWEPLQRLTTMAPSREVWLRDLVAEYDKQSKP